MEYLNEKEQLNLRLQLHDDVSPKEKEKVKKELAELDKSWEKRVQEYAKIRFTKETYQAILLTCRSMAACVRYLLDDLDFHFVLTRKFASDKIESHFGAIRQLLGGNFKGDALSVMFTTEKILRTGIVYSPINGNVILEREKQKSYICTHQG